MPQQRQDIDRVVRRRRWSETDARAVVAAWRGSGESQSAFARRHGVDPQRVGHWIRRLDSETSGETSALPFHPVRVVHRGVAVGAAECAPIEIVLADGRAVRVPRGVEARELRLVLEVLGDGSC